MRHRQINYDYEYISYRAIMYTVFKLYCIEIEFYLRN